MVGKKININTKLHGSTLVEIIVASVILLSCFLLFSVFTSQLYNARNVNDEMKILLTFPLLSYNNNISEMDIDKLCKYCVIRKQTISDTKDWVEIQRMADGQVVFSYYRFIPPKVIDSLFQK